MAGRRAPGPPARARWLVVVLAAVVLTGSVLLQVVEARLMWGPTLTAAGMASILAGEHVGRRARE